MLKNFNRFFKEKEEDSLIIVGFILISFISFVFGFLLGGKSLNKEMAEIKIEKVPIKEFQGFIKEVGERKKRENLGENLSKKKLQEENYAEENQKKEEIKEKNFQIIGNKKSKIYHYSWCPSTKRIKEENKIYFNSKEEAEKEGYRLSKNCKEK